MLNMKYLKIKTNILKLYSNYKYINLESIY